MKSPEAREYPNSSPVSEALMMPSLFWDQIRLPEEVRPALEP